MVNRLAAAISPYLRSHADNPVDWFPWGQDAFDEAERRDVPLFISIGYATCHWCHVMARESFSDPVIASFLAANFVAVKVDREEHPEVDSSYLAQASAFTQQLGWPLSVFATPSGAAFFAGTYFPPSPVGGRASFAQVLQAVVDAWSDRREQAMQNAEAIVSAIADMGETAEVGRMPDATRFAEADALLAAAEDHSFGGYGLAPKFPVVPVLSFVLGGAAPDHAVRTLRAIARSPLRDPVDGGFFRYATERDWSKPHYERMLYDNALLLASYARAFAADPSRAWAEEAASGIARFLLETLQLPSGGFASAQDSESELDGARSEGGYYALDPAERASQSAPDLDQKVITGWNGLAIGALAEAGRILDRADWLEAARWAADKLLEKHLDGAGQLLRVSVGERRSTAAATLEDYGMLAGGLIELAAATGEVRYAVIARSLVDAALAAGEGRGEAFASPGGGDPVLGSRGLLFTADPSEGAYPSGISATAAAAWKLFLLTDEHRYRAAVEAALLPLAEQALASPISFGSTLETLRALGSGASQLVVVTPDDVADAVPAEVRRRRAELVAIVSDAQAAEFALAGFGLFDGRTARDGRAVSYACEDFVCAVPETV